VLTIPGGAGFRPSTVLAANLICETARILHDLLVLKFNSLALGTFFVLQGSGVAVIWYGNYHMIYYSILQMLLFNMIDRIDQ